MAGPRATPRPERPDDSLFKPPHLIRAGSPLPRIRETPVVLSFGNPASTTPTSAPTGACSSRDLLSRPLLAQEPRQALRQLGH